MRVLSLKQEGMSLDGLMQFRNAKVALENLDPNAYPEALLPAALLNIAWRMRGSLGAEINNCPIRH